MTGAEARAAWGRAWIFTCIWLAVAAFGGFLSGRVVERLEHHCPVAR